MTLTTLFSQVVKRNANSLAIISIDDEYTYGQLQRWVEGIARGLRRLGVQREDRVVVLLSNRPVTVAVIWAIWRLGAIAVLLNISQPGRVLCSCIADADPKMLIYEPLDGINKKTIAAVVDTKPLVVGVDTVDADIEIGELVRLAPKEALPVGDFDEDDVCLMIYTSGTTGRPKGVPRSHKNTLAAAFAHCRQNLYRSQDRVLGAMPIAHTMGLHLMVATVALGATYVMVNGTDADGMRTVIERRRVSALYHIPSWYYVLLHSGDTSRFDFSSVSKLCYAGSMMSEDLIRQCIDRFQPRVFVNHYGSTEIYTHTVANVLARKPGSAGKPGLHGAIRIDGGAGPESLGEVLVSLESEEAFRGYWHRPDLNAQSLDQGWYRTGDLGYVDEDGDLFVVGRRDELIISGGEHVAPQRVESVLLEHPKVAEVAVTSEPDIRWGHLVVAYVVPRVPGVTVHELDSFCKRKETLSFWERPRKYVFVRKIPKSASGKVLRRELANLEGGL